MSVSFPDVQDEHEPIPDSTAGSFTYRRDPPSLRELITTFSELYVDSDEDSNSDSLLDLPFPPLPVEEAAVNFRDPRRDVQLKAKLQSYAHLISTPVPPSLSTPTGS